LANNSILDSLFNFFIYLKIDIFHLTNSITIHLISSIISYIYSPLYSEDAIYFPGIETKCTLLCLIPNTTYQFRIISQTTFGTKKSSKILCRTLSTPPPPTAISFHTVLCSSFHLSWNRPETRQSILQFTLVLNELGEGGVEELSSNEVTGGEEENVSLDFDFELPREEKEISTTLHPVSGWYDSTSRTIVPKGGAPISGESNTCTVIGLRPNHRYEVAMASLGVCGWGSFYRPTFQILMEGCPPPPSNITAESSGPGSVTVEWSRPSTYSSQITHYCLAVRLEENAKWLYYGQEIGLVNQQVWISSEITKVILNGLEQRKFFVVRMKSRGIYGWGSSSRPVRVWCGSGSIGGDEDEAVSGECVICFNHTRDSVIIPCGHFYVCYECGIQCTICPICRGEIEKVQKVYF
jgi:hypothetical protein